MSYNFQLDVNTFQWNHTPFWNMFERTPVK